MIPGFATTDPLKLCPCIREKYIALIEACRNLGVKIVPIETFRDVIRQKYYVEHKLSKTMKSKHLPQPPNGLSLAVDAAPKDVLALKGWAPGHVSWLIYTEQARALGLECGADWAGFNKGWDWPHVQLSSCQCPRKA